jgi:glycosyltransferase involved in cell wall biosynthesis
MYYINRYDIFRDRRGYSGYEQLPRYIYEYSRLGSVHGLNWLLKKVVKSKKNQGYLWSNSSKELIAIIIGMATGRPVHYLYGDKDAFFSLHFRNIKQCSRLKIFGTFHWPLHIHDEERLKQFRNFDKVIAMGRGFAQELKPYCKEVAFIPHGIDLQYWTRKTVYAEKAMKSNQILLVGQSNRDHYNQLELVRKIATINQELKFVVVLRDPEYTQHYYSIPNVQVIGTFLEDSDLKKLYDESLAMLLIQEYCIASNAVLESLAMGLPLITNKVGDIADYLGEDYPYIRMDRDIEEQLTSFFEENHLVQLSEKMRMQAKEFAWELIAEQTKAFLSSK